MSTYTPNFYGIDAEYVQQVTRKARRDRSKAIRQMIQGIFPSVSDRQCDREPDRVRNNAASALRPAAV